MSRQRKHFYDFGPYRVDTVKRLLLKDGEPVALTPKAFDTLLALVESDGEAIAKQELMSRVWPDSFVEEGNLAVNISMLRKALGETPNQHRYIVTVPGHGYRFVADVREILDQGIDVIVEEQTRAQFVIEGEEEKPKHESRGIAALKSKAVAFAAKVSQWRMSRTVMVTCALAVALTAAMFYYYSRSQIAQSLQPTAQPVVKTRRTVAVLPFRLIAQKKDDKYLGFGIADILITKLSSIKQIIVRPTSAIRKYMDAEQDPIAAGRELKVDSVLQGSIYQQGGRTRITLQMTNVEDGSSLWAGKFDENKSNTFEVQDSISEQVARALAIKLSSVDTELLNKRYTQNTEAYQLYQKGRYFWDRRSTSNLKKSIEYFEEALRKDPDFALAYAGLADSYALLVSGGGDYSMHSSDAITKAREAVMNALRLDESLADAHTSLGIIHLNYDWDWASAEREFRRALELNPGSSNAHYWYSLYLTAMDRQDEAIAEGRLAAEIEPLEPLMFAQVARALIYAERYEEAIIESRKGLELDSNRFIARYMLAEAYLGLKQYDAAIEEYKKASQSDEGGPLDKASLAVAYALSGQPAEAQKVLAELHKLEAHQYVSPYYFIDLYSSIGDWDKAFDWVERAYQERAGCLAYAKVDNVLVRLRNDPRYTNLLVRLRLLP